MTAGYHQHIFWHPTLLKIPFRRMKTFSRNILSSANFDKFCNFQIFLVSTENPQFRWKKRHFHDSWLNIIWYAFYSNFVTFTDIEERILRQSCYSLVIKSFQIQKGRTFGSVWHFQLTSKLKKVSALSVDDFCSILWIWAKNNYYFPQSLLYVAKIFL